MSDASPRRAAAGPETSVRPDARERILARLAASLQRREAVEHPGPFGAWRNDAPASSAGRVTGPPSPVTGFTEMFEAAGGEVVRVPSLGEAADWLHDFARVYPTCTTGDTLPEALRPPRPVAAADEAALAVSCARGAVAETGSLLLDARDGRRTQLLAPHHVVIVQADTVHRTLYDALEDLRPDLPSAIGLHSGPSKSADIGQVMVKGVHGPGRVIAVIVEEQST